MADTIPDLWPTSELKSAVLTPIVILRTQATLLGQKTQGLLMGDVRVTTSEKGQLTLSFTVIAPAVNNYRYNLLSVQHTVDASYPAKISADGLTNIETIPSIFPMGDRKVTTSVSCKTAYSEREFIRIVQEVLQAPATIAKLQSLIVRSNEETVSSLPVDDQNIEQSDASAE